VFHHVERPFWSFENCSVMNFNVTVIFLLNIKSEIVVIRVIGSSTIKFDCLCRFFVEKTNLIQTKFLIIRVLQPDHNGVSLVGTQIRQ
jgi:hypothetical protein